MVSNSTPAHRQELKYEILKASMPLFKKKGIKATRMDDVAAALSISKRTLYEIYDNKEILLLEGIKMEADEMEKQISDYAMTAENELDIVVTYFRLKFNDLESISPLFLTDIKKYDAVTRYLRDRHDEQQQKSAKFIRKCIESRFFIPEIKYDLIQDLCEIFMSKGVSSELFNKYTPHEIFSNFFIVLLRGFCTEEGLKLLDLYIKKTCI